MLTGENWGLVAPEEGAAMAAQRVRVQDDGACLHGPARRAQGAAAMPVRPELALFVNKEL